MQLYFLDVVDADVSRSVDLTLIIVVAATILVEALTMWWINYNPFGKSLLDSVVLNGASVSAGYVLVEMVPSLFGDYGMHRLLILWLITVAIECPLLYLLNRKKPFRETLIAAILVNVISYFLFYVYLRFTQ